MKRKILQRKDEVKIKIVLRVGNVTTNQIVLVMKQ